MSKINGKIILFYFIRKNNNSVVCIGAVTKTTNRFLHGTFIFNNIKDKVNKNFRINKNFISKFINEYDFTKSLDLDKTNK